eukprot:9559056-Heterocapsa_arctica.AAC.1
MQNARCLKIQKGVVVGATVAREFQVEKQRGNSWHETARYAGCTGDRTVGGFRQSSTSTSSWMVPARRDDDSRRHLRDLRVQRE